MDFSERLGRYRWVLERTIAWLLAFRRLAVRYDRSATTITAVATVAITIICARRLAGRTIKPIFEWFPRLFLEQSFWGPPGPRGCAAALVCLLDLPRICRRAPEEMKMRHDIQGRLEPPRFSQGGGALAEGAFGRAT